jgi:hypothetical protein
MTPWSLNRASKAAICSVPTARKPTCSRLAGCVCVGGGGGAQSHPQARDGGDGVCACGCSSQNAYNLVLATDLYTKRYMQWFYFRVSNTRQGCTYTFNLTNLTKVLAALHAHGAAVVLPALRSSRPRW